LIQGIINFIAFLQWLVTKKAEQRWEKYTYMLQSAASALDQSSSLLGTQKKQTQNPGV
jgi:hypothetical protein